MCSMFEPHPISEITPSEACHKFDEYDLRPANLVVVERSLWERRGRMEEDEKAIMMLVVIVGFVLIWVVLEELNYLGLPIK
ncbi:hypothetical protein HJ059_16025 [Vibrio parahaemolyticus]|uniref:hypothetical protein n=2 Tax=Vibrio parahaemolyticus TaxID=670 RepID=UPI0011236901|nr:hypothetical protein [Vibrio parahaemolyticus]MBE4349054.1 hypothetical protein [Vibrio parahaemolyticus]MDF4746370.1 hypothetical protein [Vibrio parahaemolyticus]NMU68917.1 hypothetical protein [Vibrio parahaemolyticus]HCG8568945.1 hypothetical protein [Vibrio parahaemolyticus]HCG8571110.1 hypothetical protein [Vibrio parahaemolyticus]